VTRLVADRRTGEVVGLVELLPDAGLGERFAALAAGMPEPGPDGIKAAWVRCDGCGGTEGVDAAAPVLPAGWVTRPGGEFCPACAGGH
jgi:hypothetical protein